MHGIVIGLFVNKYEFRILFIISIFEALPYLMFMTTLDPAVSDDWIVWRIGRVHDSYATPFRVVLI
jgi:hypothetical protein